MRQHGRVAHGVSVVRLLQGPANFDGERELAGFAGGWSILATVNFDFAISGLSPQNFVQ
jgi:hypothetical protein